jgi:hypothetical protein
MGRSAELPVKPSRDPRIAATEHDQHASSAPHRLDNRRKGASMITRHDEIDRSRHCVTSTANTAARPSREYLVRCELVIASNRCGV